MRTGVSDTGGIKHQKNQTKNNPNTDDIFRSMIRELRDDGSWMSKEK